MLPGQILKLDGTNVVVSSRRVSFYQPSLLQPGEIFIPGRGPLTEVGTIILRRLNCYEQILTFINLKHQAGTAIDYNALWDYARLHWSRGDFLDAVERLVNSGFLNDYYEEDGQRIFWLPTRHPSYLDGQLDALTIVVEVRPDLAEFIESLRTQIIEGEPG